MKKQITNRLQTTKSKNKKSWSSYQNKKKKILSKKISPEKKKIQIENIYKSTKEKVKKNWSGYQDFKYTKTHKTPFQGLQVISKPKYYNPEKKKRKYQTFKLKNSKGLENVIKKKGKDIAYILVMVKIKLPQTDVSTIVSESFGELEFKSLTPSEMVERTTEKLSSKIVYEGFELINTFVKIIYK